MRVRFSESFPKEMVDADGALRLIRQLVDERLAAEILRRMPKVPQGERP